MTYVFTNDLAVHVVSFIIIYISTKILRTNLAQQIETVNIHAAVDLEKKIKNLTLNF